MTAQLRGALGVLAYLAMTGLASSHVTLETTEAAAGSTYRAVLRIPHGCDGKPTETLRVAIPEGVTEVKPMPKAGWALKTVKGASAPATGGDKSAAEAVSELVWSGGSLEDSFYDEFVFRARLTPELSGKTVYFKVVQECGEARAAWSDIPAEGQAGQSLKSPAPALKILAKAAAPGHAAIKAGDLTIEAAWSRATPGGAKVGVGYLTVTNRGTAPDRLLAGASEVASRIEVHEMTMVDNTMRMRPLDRGIEIRPGETVALKPGGVHLMLMNLSRTLKEGEAVPATLTFEKAGSVAITLDVQGIGAQAAPAGEHKH